MNNADEASGQGPGRAFEPESASFADAAHWDAGLGSAGGSLIGRMIGAYRVEARIGGGAMAAVYRGVDVISGRAVALKVLLADADETVRERFRLEAQMVSTLNHPNIVHTLGVSPTTRDEGLTYIAMELVEGRSLSELLENVHTLNVADSCALLAPVARALAYAHSRNVVHRDVKPSNILLRRVAPGSLHAVRLTILDNPVVPLLSDFGIARALDAPDLTTAGRTIGTPAYMSPEQCSGTREIDGRADIYSLGAVLYRCLVGRSPFAGTTTQILYAHVYDPLTIPEDALRLLSPLMVEILRRSMAKNPEDRYASAAQMAADLGAGAGGSARPPAQALAAGATDAAHDPGGSDAESEGASEPTLTLAGLTVAPPREGLRIIVPAPRITPAAAQPVIDRAPVAPPESAGPPPLAARPPVVQAGAPVPMAGAPIPLAGTPGGARIPAAPAYLRSAPPGKRASPWRGVTIGLMLAIPIFLLLATGVGALLRIGPFRTAITLAAITPAAVAPAAVTLASIAPETPTAHAAAAIVPTAGGDASAAIVDASAAAVTLATPAAPAGADGSTATLAPGQSGDAPALSPTPPELLTPEPTPAGDINAYWQDAQDLFAQEEWRQAADFLTLVQRIRGDFQPGRVNEMISESNLRSALQSMRAHDLTGAAAALAKAAEAQPDNSAVKAMAAAAASAAAQPDDAAARDALRSTIAGIGADRLAGNDPCAAADALEAALAVGAGSDAPIDARAEIDNATAVRSQCTLVRQALADQTTLTSLPGSLLYSTQVDPENYRIYSVPAAAGSSAEAVIADGRQPAHSPRDSLVAFRSTRPDVVGIAGFDLAADNDPSSRSILYTRGVGDAVDSPPSWNGSGDHLVYATVDPADQRSRVYTVAADGRDTPRLLGPGLSPAWNPVDGSIVYNGVGPDGQQPGLWLIDSDGSGPTRLTNSGADMRPAWSPDGATVVFMSNGRSDDWDVFRVGVKDGVVTQLTTESSQDGLPTISPDGQYVAFVSDRGGSWNIWVKPVAGGRTLLLAPIEGSLTNWLEHALQWNP